jgi:hypothetical protein
MLLLGSLFNLRVSVRLMGGRTNRDEVCDPDHAVQCANSCLSCLALVGILNRPSEGDPAVVNLHPNGPLRGVREPGCVARIVWLVGAESRVA